MKTLLAVLAGGTCFCCNSKLRAGEVWRGNSSVGLVSMAHVYFHWKQQIFTFRSIIYSSDKHYGFRLALLDDANIFLLGGISLFSLFFFFFSPGWSFEIKWASSSQGLDWIHPLFSFSGEETASIPSNWRILEPTAPRLLLHNRWVGEQHTHMLMWATYAALSAGQTPADRTHRVSIRLKVKLFICACGTEFHLCYGIKKKTLALSWCSGWWRISARWKAEPCDSYSGAGSYYAHSHGLYVCRSHTHELLSLRL